MKKFYKMAIISFAFAFAACDDSTSATDNGEDGANVACTDEPVECPSIHYENEVHDLRDCNHYKIQTFGTQTWMIENLSYSSCKIKSFCYNNDPANCEQYGRLYTWTDAMGLDKSYQKKYANLTGPQQGICPQGYHMPSDAEWQMLYDFIEANGDDATAFSFQLGGAKSFSGFKDSGRKGYFWTADEDNSEFGGPGNAIIWTYTDTFGFGGGSVMKDSGLSVRCVKD
jgi:hypothetical protein